MGLWWRTHLCWHPLGPDPWVVHPPVVPAAWCPLVQPAYHHPLLQLEALETPRPPSACRQAAVRRVVRQQMVWVQEQVGTDQREAQAFRLWHQWEL
jgi:hypothetical protein